MFFYKKQIVAITIFVFLNICVEHISTATVKCYDCDSTNKDCINKLENVSLKDCEHGCLVQIDNGKVTRGCWDGTSACESPNCFKTPDEKSNNNIVCKSCSSVDDVQCAQTANLPATIALCATKVDSCSIIIDNKNTIRRCATNDDVTSVDVKLTKVCTGSNCNVGIFPADRISCYQCDSTGNTGDKDCAVLDTTSAGKIVSKPCALYDAGDQCYTFATDAANVLRGCVSDASANNKCSVSASNALCATCTRNDCNDSGAEKDQDLKCITCTGTQDENDICQWGQPAENAKKCNNRIGYNAEEKCYTQIKNEIVYRGCYFDRDQTLLGECTSENNCTTCTDGYGCNNRQTSFTCVRCRSNENSECYDKADNVPPTECRNIVTNKDGKCFHGIWNNVVIRGCLVDADEQQRAICLDADNKQCIECDGSGCNTKKTSGAQTNSLQYGLVAILITTIIALRS